MRAWIRSRRPRLVRGSLLFLLAAVGAYALHVARRSNDELGALLQARLATLRQFSEKADDLARYRAEERPALVEGVRQARESLPLGADASAAKAALLTEASRAGVALLRCDVGIPRAFAPEGGSDPGALLGVPFGCVAEGSYASCAAMLAGVLGGRRLVVPTRLVLGRAGSAGGGPAAESAEQAGGSAAGWRAVLESAAQRPEADHRISLEGLLLAQAPPEPKAGGSR